MAKNQVQFQKGLSLPKFLKHDGSEEQCRDAVFRWRRPRGFTWVNTMTGNVKNSFYGTYHAISDRHLPRYLAEFCYRFNRRFKLEDKIPRLGYPAVRTPPMPERLLRMGDAWR